MHDKINYMCGVYVSFLLLALVEVCCHCECLYCHFGPPGNFPSMEPGKKSSQVGVPVYFYSTPVHLGCH